MIGDFVFRILPSHLFPRETGKVSLTNGTLFSVITRELEVLLTVQTESAVHGSVGLSLFSLRSRYVI
jgi:hypothetical protein